MKTTRKVRRDAKRLFRLCLMDGVLDEDRARRVAKRVVDGGRRNRWAVLRCFGRLVKRDRALHTATVESAVPLSPDLQAGVLRDLSRAYGPALNTTFRQRPSLIGGMRIRVGNDVYDGTVQARLAALERSL